MTGAARLVAAVAALRGHGRPGSPVGGAAGQQAARSELRNPAYQHGRPGPISRFLAWLGHRADSFTAHLGGGGHALLLLFLVLLVIALVFVIRLGLPARRAKRADGGEPDLLAPDSTVDHRRRAMQFTADGRRAEALREWLRAAVRTIEDRGVLPPRPGRTGAATAREAGRLLPAAAEALTSATQAFDEVWFGGRAATDEDVARAQAAADAVTSARIAVGSDSGFAVPK